jgi:hypothetical protein
MSSLFSLVPARMFAIVIALAFALCLLGTYATAQANQPKDEVFGGYSWLHPNGYADLGFRVKDIVDGFDLSNVYYLPGGNLGHNLGILADGSGHFNGGTNPINPVNGGNTGTSVGYALGGLQYKYHAETFSPFVRVFLGTASLSPDCCGGTKWSFAAGGGGGFDLAITPMFSIRLAQVDYIYSNYSQRFPSGHDSQWNSIRLASGLVLTLGSYYNPPLSCAASATPAEVWADDPVKVTTTGTNFNPKHPLTYAWTANGGKLSGADAQTATIDTTGMAPGSYSASSTITDAKMKKMNSATCPAPFSIKQPQPPVVSCSANPTTIAIGEASTVTMTATDPQGWPMTYSWSATGGTLSSSGTTATVTATNADAGNTITVTGTATDGRANLSASCTAMVTSPAIQKCVNIEDWGECTFEKNPKKPWRVDNDCKDTLDKLSLRLQQMPNGKLDVVGYTDEKEVMKEQTLGSQRSVNVKYYLTTDGPNKADASRIQPRQGGTKGKATHFYFVPEGPLCGGQLEEGTAVDETVVKGQSRTAAAPKKRSAKAKPAAPPAQ